MFIPYSTDAPIYHWPVATVGLIVVNTAVFFAAVTGQLPHPELWILNYGESLTPLQWLLSMFLHFDVGHLLGNMIFLWVFGLVIEGKIGWWRFLLCYLGIGIVQSAGEQSLQLFLGGEGGSLGASSAIYGLLAMAAIWAPKNDIMVFYWFFLIYVGTGEIAIMIFALLYIGFDLFFAVFFGVQTSSWLHLGGAMLGAPLAVLMLKYNMVDCEGWDIFHVLRDETGTSSAKDRTVDPVELTKLQQQRDAKLLEDAQEQLALYFAAENYSAAFVLYKKLQPVGEGLTLSRTQLMKLIAALHKEKRWHDSCPLMAEVVQRFPEKSQAVLVKLAQICLVELQRPGKSIELLKSVDLHQLSPNMLTLAQKVAQRAKQLQAEGAIELENDPW